MVAADRGRSRAAVQLGQRFLDKIGVGTVEKYWVWRRNVSGVGSIHHRDSGFLAILGRLSFVFMALMIAYASFSPPQMIPHILYSYHLEHFAIFYFLGIATSSAFVRRDVYHIGLAIWVAALLIEAVRWLNPIHRDFAIVDWFADAAGAAAALVPIRIGHFRNGFGPTA